MPVPLAANMAIVDEPLLTADSKSTSASTTPVSDTTASDIDQARPLIERHEWKILLIQTLHDLTLLGIPFPLAVIQTLTLCGSYAIKRHTKNDLAYHQNINKHFQVY